MIIINSDDSEVSRRLAQMLEETGYITYILNDLQEIFDFNTTKPELIIIECRPDCLIDDNRIKLIKKMNGEVPSELILMATVEQIADIKALLGDNGIKFLAKPILYTNFVRQVKEILHSTKCS